METVFPADSGNPPAWSAALPERERAVLEKAVPEKAGKTLTPQASAVLAAVADGAAERLPELVAVLSEQERRSCLRLLRAWLAPMHETSEDYGTRTPEVWQAAERRKEALRVACAGCAAGAADAAKWITHRSIEWSRGNDLLVLRTLAERPKEWLADVAQRVLARTSRDDLAWGRFPLVEGLVALSDAPVFANERFVLGWLNDRTPNWSFTGSAWPDVVDEGSEPRAEYGDWDLFVDRLRADPFLDRVLPHVFDADGSGHLMQRRKHWAIVLSAFAGSGRLDRGMLVDGALGRLLRPGRPNELRGFRELLDALAPTGDEYAAHTVTLLRILPDAPSPEAGYAQKILVGLDEAGRLSDEHLAEASASVLFRTEKTLVRAQLSWLDRAARRDRSRAGVAVLAAADAFGHPDPALQERALALVERHLKHAGDAVRADLTAAAEALSPALRPRAAELLGASETGEQAGPAVVLPAVPEARPVAPPITGAAEVAIEINAILVSMRSGGGEASGLSVDVPAFERVLDGLVRCARADRDALLAELRAVAEAHPWGMHRCGDDWHPGDVRHVVAEALGEEPRKADCGYQGFWHPHGSAPLSAVLRERLREVAGMVAGGDGPPFLLAVPTLSDGRIDPAVLVDRIAGYERLGVVPGGVDLSQALLRVDTGAADEGVLDDARRLSSEAGAGLSAWLEAGGLPEPEPVREDVGACRCGYFQKNHLMFVHEGLTAPCALHEVFAPLLGTGSAPRSRTVPDSGVDGWSAALPLRRELVALHLQQAFLNGKAPLLPVLAEARGAAGPALHLGVACALGSKREEHRTAAVDALLAMAARGDLDTGLLVSEMVEAVRYGVVEPGGLAASTRALVGLGFHRTAWAALEAVLPILIEASPLEPNYTKYMNWQEKDRVAKTRELGEVVEAAAECAHLCGAKGEIPQVSALAARKGSGRLLKAARTLRGALGGGAASADGSGAVPDAAPPAVFEARPVAAPMGGAAEVADGIDAILASAWFDRIHRARVVPVDVPAFERVLDGLVRCARADRDALLAELRTTAERHPWRDFPRETDWNTGDVRRVVAEALGEATGAELWEEPGEEPEEAYCDFHEARHHHGTAPLNAVLRERLREVAGMVAGGDGPPFLLAVPTLSDGRIDPAVLVDRIAGYERLGVVPGGVDLSQALLRVDTGAATEGVLADARRLSSEAGAGLAAWLEAGGLPEPEPVLGGVLPCDLSSREERKEDKCYCRVHHGDGFWNLLFGYEGLTAPGELHEVFAPVLAGGRDKPQHGYVPSENAGHWPAAVPLRRELVALHLQRTFLDEEALLLPALAAAHGAAGPVLHVGVARGMNSRAACHRTAAVDALSVLAARGDLDAALLGRFLAEAVQVRGSGYHTKETLVTTVREAVRRGAHAVVWAVLAEALPVMLADVDEAKALRPNEDLNWSEQYTASDARSASVVLAEAVECARRSGARGEIPEVSALAAREEPVRLVEEARRLRDVLAGV
ncbi:DUF6493 family protein [Actinorugispora endophytica]|uniref:HEAT repeat protein n=1 Tax=Actinorugispora endophytica TaxID=1605990 RepID=A0A4R6V6F5_9ACTN|nr:DUF6493 family protein [Actinorugispora endophytica]TDQ54455.1 hypothetical protein EV190_102289 [Actinorugispora endophytica]